MIKVSIDKDELQRMKDAYATILALKREFEGFFKWADNGEAANGLPSLSSQSDNGAVYSKKFTLKQKGAFCLKEKPEGMTTKEMVARLIELEPSLESDRKKLVGSISSILSSKDNSTFFKKSLNERGENIYTLR